MHSIHRLRRLMAFTLLASVAATAGAQTVVGSTFQLGVWADANQNVAGNVQDTYLTSQGATLNPYSRSLSVTDFDTVNGGSLTVTSSASASWVNSGKGSVLWRGMGWVHDTYTSSGAKLNDFVVVGPVWSYTFIPAQSGFFNLLYDVRGFGNKFGLQGVEIHWSGPEGGVDLRNPFDPVANGAFSRPVTAGIAYTIGLRNNGNVFSAPLRRVDFGYMDADFNWELGAVPEPASMVVLSLSLVALLKRKR